MLLLCFSRSGYYLHGVTNSNQYPQYSMLTNQWIINFNADDQWSQYHPIWAHIYWLHTNFPLDMKWCYFPQTQYTNNSIVRKEKSRKESLGKSLNGCQQPSEPGGNCPRNVSSTWALHVLSTFASASGLQMFLFCLPPWLDEWPHTAVSGATFNDSCVLSFMPAVNRNTSSDSCEIVLTKNKNIINTPRPHDNSGTEFSVWTMISFW